MKAALVTKYGAPEVISIETVADPVAKRGELLVDVRASTVSAGDARIRAARFPLGFAAVSRMLFGLFAPRNPVLGIEVSGVVRAVGPDVSAWKVGDEVFGMCGMRFGAHAEHCVLRADGPVAKKPSNLSFDQAAALSFGGTTALDFFRRARLQRGDRILINGASGAVGVAAVQLARHFGAHVTAVCSRGNSELVRELGAHEVVDYSVEDFCSRNAAFDVVMDNVGNAPYSRSKRALAPKGRLLLVVATLPQILGSLWINVTTDKTVIAGPSGENADDMRLLATLAEKGEYRAVIDRRYELDRAGDAHAYVDGGHKKGSVVLAVR